MPRKDYSKAVLPTVEEMNVRYKYYAGEYARRKAIQTRIVKDAYIIAGLILCVTLIMGVVHYG